MADQPATAAAAVPAAVETPPKPKEKPRAVIEPMRVKAGRRKRNSSPSYHERRGARRPYHKYKYLLEKAPVIPDSIMHGFDRHGLPQNVKLYRNPVPDFVNGEARYSFTMRPPLHLVRDPEAPDESGPDTLANRTERTAAVPEVYMARLDNHDVELTIANHTSEVKIRIRNNIFDYANKFIDGNE